MCLVDLTLMLSGEGFPVHVGGALCGVNYTIMVVNGSPSARPLLLSHSEADPHCATELDTHGLNGPAKL